MLLRIKDYKDGKIVYEKLLESSQGWDAYAKRADSFKLREEFVKKIFGEQIVL